MANNNAYSIGQPLTNVFASPIVQRFNPTTSNNQYQLGQLWMNQASATAFILTHISPTSGAVWVQITDNGDATFDNLTVLDTLNVVNTANLDTVNISGTFVADVGANNITLNTDSGEILVQSQLDPGGTPTNTVTVQSSAGINSNVLINCAAGTLTDAVNITAPAGGVTINGSTGATLQYGGNIGTSGVQIFNGTQFASIYVGTASPNGVVTANRGSLFINTAGTAGNTSLYVNVSSPTPGTTWLVFTAA